MILEYIKRNHNSSCMFPECDCTCKINFDTDLISSGFLDSFSVVALRVFIETNFSVVMPEDKELNTINKIVNYIG